MAKRVPRFRSIVFGDVDGVPLVRVSRGCAGGVEFRVADWLVSHPDPFVSGGVVDRQVEVLWWLLEGDLSRPPSGWCFEESTADVVGSVH